jgi:hypothetical protein
MKDNWTFTKADFQKVVDSMINSLLQEKTNLQSDF